MFTFAVRSFAFKVSIRAAAGLCGWLALLGALACSPVQTVVVLDVEPSVLEDTRALRVLVCDPDGAVAADETRLAEALRLPDRPERVPIEARGGDASRVFAFEATLIDEAGQALGTQRVFSDHRGAAEVERRFDAACLGVQCLANQTCDAGACVSAVASGPALSPEQANARLSCCVPSGAETCDGVDQDCDGRIDEADGQPSLCIAMGRTRVREDCDDGSNPWNGSVGDRVRLNRTELVLPNLVLDGAYMYLDGDDADQSHRIVIYDDDGGADDPGGPGTLLAVSTERAIASDDPPAWYRFEGWERAPRALVPKTYWIGAISSPTRTGGSTLYNGCVVDAGDGRLGDQSYADGPSDDFGATGAFRREMTLFVTFAP